MSSKATDSKAVFALFMIILWLYNVEAATNSSGSSTPSGWGQTYHCYITNWLPDRVFPIKLHIYSSENDLGIKYLNPNQSFYWKFKMNVPSSTNFQGEFWWAEKDSFFTAFDARVSETCGITGVCVWVVQPDGFYLAIRRDPRDDDLKWWYGWRTPPTVTVSSNHT